MQALALARFSFICETCTMSSKSGDAAAQLTFNGAVSLTLSQHFMTRGLSRTDVGTLLGALPQSISNRLYDRAKWSAEELAVLAARFGVPVDALMPSPDGAGGWVPAPYAPASRAPARGSAGEAVVPQAGLEPATDGL